MASDRTRELAKELYDKCICTKAGDIWNEESAMALDAFERETRLDEATWWANRSQHMQSTHWDGCEKAHPECARFAALAQPAPGVKK